MDRPLVRDLVAWITPIPTSLILFACLSLPQYEDCHGHVQTAADAGTTPLIVVMALVALVPLLWQVRHVRKPLVVLVGGIAGVAVMSNMLVVPIAIYCVARRPWRSSEHFVAFGCCCIALVFLLLIPLITLWSTWLAGADWAWGSAFVVLIASGSWMSAARERTHTLEPLAVGLPAPIQVPPADDWG